MESTDPWGRLVVYVLVYFNGPINGMAAIGHRMEIERGFGHGQVPQQEDNGHFKNCYESIKRCSVDGRELCQVGGLGMELDGSPKRDDSSVSQVITVTSTWLLNIVWDDDGDACDDL